MANTLVKTNETAQPKKDADGASKAPPIKLDEAAPKASDPITRGWRRVWKFVKGDKKKTL